jgi:PAS domain S-box-containing protein
VGSVQDAWSALDEASYDLLVTDWHIHDESARAFLAPDGPGLPVVVLSSQASLRGAVEALRAGALDYLSSDESGFAGLLDSCQYALSVWKQRAEQERAARAARAQEELHRFVAEQSPDALALLDHDGRCLYSSPAARALLGYESEYLGRINLFSLVHAEERPAVLRRWTALHPSEPALEYCRVAHAQGGYRALELSFRATHWKGSPCRLLVARDATERRARESRRFHAQKMSALGRLAGKLAHDFNNSFAVLFASLSNVEENPHHAQEDLQAAQRELQRAAEFTRRLLEFTPHNFSRPQALALHPFLSSLEAELGQILGASLSLSLRLAPSLPVVFADAKQLAQVLAQLVSNARDASHEGSCIEIETSTKQVSQSRGLHALAPGEYACIQVRDQGAGMAPNTLRLAFEPFFSTKQRDGLGLTTCYGIIQQHNGAIHLHSEPNRGTCVEVLLPLMEETSQAPPHSAPRPPPQTLGGTETLLLVDDNHELRASLSRALKACGYTILQASDGLEGIEVAEKLRHHIHLLLTDIAMPRLDGLALARRFQELVPGAPVILLSAYPVGIAEDMFDGNVAYLQKPVLVSALTERIRAMLSPKTRES